MCDDYVFSLLEMLLPGCPDDVRNVAASWVRAVKKWNRRVSITAARDDKELCDLMLVDACVLARHLRKGARVVDVGTGAGAPGLPLALVRPDLEVTLVEPMQKRAALLRLHAPDNARVVQARGEAIDGHFDVAVSRATLAPGAWLELGAHLADEVWVMLAREEPPQRPGAIVALDETYPWPLTEVQRRLVKYTFPT